MTTVFYTKDIPGEREWLLKKHPSHDHRETFSTGKWKAIGAASSVEIPYTDQDTENFLPGPITKTIKTVYKQIHDPFDDATWTKADELLINNEMEFRRESSTKIDSYRLYTFGRCGSVFVESLLQKRLKRVKVHYIPESDYLLEAESVSPDNIEVILLYRKNWWNWLCSTAIGHFNGFFHYDDNINWAEAKKINITPNVIEKYRQQQKSTFNYWCNLRTKYPKKVFKLYTYEDAVEHNEKRTDHRKINYSHRELIANYDESKKIFEENHLPAWVETERRIISHLDCMKINFISGKI